MFPILFQSFWLPLREIKSVIKIFWPLVAIYIILMLVLNFLFPVPEVTSDGGVELLRFSTEGIALKILTIFICMVYIILIAYGGIIKWHRKVILDEEATALNLVPGKKELKYLGYSLLFGIVFVLIGLFVLRILAPAILGSGQNVQVTALTFAMLNKIYLFKLLGILICNAIFLLLIGKHLLRLPNLAVEGGAFDFSLFAEEKLGWIFLVLAGSFIIMLLHYCLFLLHFSIFSIEDLQQLALNRKFVFSSLNIVFSALSTFLGVYTALTYASLLSLFYREYR